MDSVNELGRCLAFLRELDRRCAERRIGFDGGSALFCDSLPAVRSLNVLVVDAGANVTARELAAQADELQGGAGLRHRRVQVDDDGLGARLAPAFGSLGWKVEPLLVMPHVRTGRPADTAEVREVIREELEPVWAEGIRGEPSLRDPDTVRQLVAQRAVIGAAGAGRHFARSVDGRPVSYCDLYSDGRTGQIEGVLTLEAHRGRGLASSVVTRALHESKAAAHDLTFLLAEENDWPKELYRKLGFEAIGRVWQFLRPPSA